MKFTYFSLLALANSIALCAKPANDLLPKVEFVQYQVQQPLTSKEYSGYHAFIHATNIIEYVQKRRPGAPFALSHTQYFSNESASWPSLLYQARLQRYLQEVLLKELVGSTYIPAWRPVGSTYIPAWRPGKPLYWDCYKVAPEHGLEFEDGVLRYDVPEEIDKSIRAAFKIIPNVASVLLEKGNTPFRFEREEIHRIFAQEAERLNKPAVGAAFDTLFPKLTTISLSAQEHPALYDCKNLISFDFKTLLWLLCLIAADSAAHSLSDAFLAYNCRSSEYSSTKDDRYRYSVRSPYLYDICDLTTDQQAPGKLSVGFMSFDGSWMCCVAEQWYDKICIHALDPQNIDRKNQPEIQRLIDRCEEHTSRSTRKSDWEEANFDAPYAHVDLSELPSTEQLLGRVPEHIQLMLQRLRHHDIVESTNALLFHGPPGTGKTTLCQRIAREAGCLIVYASLGNFRTVYQSSHAKLIERLFNRALELIETTGKRVVILMDEIDGIACLPPYNNTQETNAVEVLMSNLDLYKNNENLFVFGTTNYLDKIQGSIAKHFIQIEVPLPDYATRERIIRYYLKELKIEIDTQTPDSISTEFLNMLIGATDGSSGDTIKDLITEAAAQYSYKLASEKEVSLAFRTNQFDFANRSLASNLRHLASLPLIALKHAMGRYKYTDMERHVYAQWIAQSEFKKALRNREKSE
jgi:SpoVK/Ycf46/Vps4 family AAA+-type ATPase